MDDLRYYLKKPGKTRKSFSLVCYKPITRTQKEYVEVPEKLQADVVSINKQLRNKTLTAHEAEIVLNELISAQYRKSTVHTLVIKHSSISDVNARILGRFWTEKYGIRYLEDEQSARSDFERAFRAIEPLSIQAASQSELQKALKKNLSSAAQIRRVSERLNEVLRFLKRDFKLQKPKKPRIEIKHLSKQDFLKLLPNFKCSNCRDLAMSLFASGARLGEAMALENEDLRGLELSITKQKSTKGKKIKLPKRDKTGTVAILDFGLADLKKWVKVEDKWDHRWHFGVELGAACKAAKVKIITPHDLRHSHAIHLLTLGANLHDVSMNLRNRIEVCQEYYTGYSHSEGTLERLKRLTSEK